MLLLFCVSQVLLSCTTYIRNNCQFSNRKLSLLPMWYGVGILRMRESTAM